MQTSVTEKQTTAVNPALAPKNPVKRLIALDVVRGITIAFMILVNNNGDFRFGITFSIQRHHRLPVAKSR